MYSISSDNFQWWAFMWWTFRFAEKWEISWRAESLSASQEESCCVELRVVGCTHKENEIFINCNQQTSDKLKCVYRINLQWSSYRRTFFWYSYFSKFSVTRGWFIAIDFMRRYEDNIKMIINELWCVSVELV